MEIEILSADGAPPGTIVSIRAGHCRRQAPLSIFAEGKNKNPLSFASDAAGLNPFKLDLLQPIGSARALLKPGPGKYTVQATGHGGEAIPVSFAVYEAGQRDSQLAALDVSPTLPQQEKEDSSTGFPVSASVAKDYLESHNIVPFIRAILQTVVRDRPVEPFGFIAKQFHSAASAVSTGAGISVEGEVVGQSKSGRIADPSSQEQNLLSPGSLDNNAMTNLRPSSPQRQGWMTSTEPSLIAVDEAENRGDEGIDLEYCRQRIQKALTIAGAPDPAEVGIGGSLMIATDESEQQGEREASVSNARDEVVPERAEGELFISFSNMASDGAVEVADIEVANEMALSPQQKRPEACFHLNDFGMYDGMPDVSTDELSALDRLRLEAQNTILQKFFGEEDPLESPGAEVIVKRRETGLKTYEVKALEAAMDAVDEDAVGNEAFDAKVAPVGVDAEVASLGVDADAASKDAENATPIDVKVEKRKTRAREALCKALVENETPIDVKVEKRKTRAREALCKALVSKIADGEQSNVDSAQVASMLGMSEKQASEIQDRFNESMQKLSESEELLAQTKAENARLRKEVEAEELARAEAEEEKRKRLAQDLVAKAELAFWEDRRREELEIAGAAKEELALRAQEDSRAAEAEENESLSPEELKKARRRSKCKSITSEPGTSAYCSAGSEDNGRSQMGHLMPIASAYCSADSGAHEYLVAGGDALEGDMPTKPGVRDRARSLLSVAGADGRLEAALHKATAVVLPEASCSAVAPRLFAGAAALGLDMDFLDMDMIADIMGVIPGLSPAKGAMKAFEEQHTMNESESLEALRSYEQQHSMNEVLQELSSENQKLKADVQALRKALKLLQAERTALRQRTPEDSRGGREALRASRREDSKRADKIHMVYASRPSSPNQQGQAAEQNRQSGPVASNKRPSTGTTRQLRPSTATRTAQQKRPGTG